MVGLILEGPELFSDNWIYIHDPGVQVGRVQNFKAWSPEMVSGSGLTSYGAEYFCNAGDALWAMEDEKLISLAVAELGAIGLLKNQRLVKATVIRQPKAYPVYDSSYAENIALIKAEIASKLSGLHLVGRNGMHKYNNQDHAVMTAMLTVENILAGKELFDVWKVNQDAEYLEEAKG